MTKDSKGIDDSSGDGCGNGSGKGIIIFYNYGGDYYFNSPNFGDGGTVGVGNGFGDSNGINSSFIDSVNL